MDSAVPGAAKNEPQACRTLGSLNTISRALITRARKIARIVITAGLPSVMAWMITAPVSWPRLAPWPAGGVPAGGGAAGEGAAGAGAGSGAAGSDSSVMAAQAPQGH